jgi:hypothetical protein
MANLEQQGHGRYVLQAWAARNSVDPADYMVVDTTQYADADQMPTIDIDLEPAPAPQPAGMGQWNGQWKVLVGGREVYRFGGVGNSQADANRIAAAWLRSSGQGVSGEGFEVYPVMNESLTETNRLTLRDFNVKLSPHYRDRAHAKGVDLRRVDDVLFNLSKVKDKIMSLEPGRAFILHDGQGTGLGMRRHLGNRLTLATVYPVSPGFNKGLYPTFRVDTDSRINESIDADQVLQYVKKTHAPDEFNIEYSITDHAAWELKNISLSELNLDPDGEQQDPYNRTNWVDYDVVRDLMPKIEQVLKANPIVVDSEGWIIDGNHRAMAAAEAGLTSVPALVPVQQDMSESLTEARNSLFAFVKQHFPTWPDYVLKDFLYPQAKGIRNQAELDDFLKRNKQDFGNCKWTLTKLPITFDIFTPKTQRMLASREGGNSNPFQVPRDAERHALQSQMIQQKGVSAEPIIVAKLSNGYDLIEGWHRTIQHLKAFPQGYTGPAWVCTGSTYKSESVEQGMAENFADGKNPGRKGLSKRVGVNTKASVSSLRKTAKNSSGEKQRMSHWLANMKAGRAKARRK